MTRPPVHCVVTGNIRSAIELKLILARACHLRRERAIDEIVLSTWTGEVDRHAGLRGTLHALGITLVEDALPAEPGMGHITFQQQSLWNAAKICPVDATIVRIRTDKIFGMMFNWLPPMLDALPGTRIPPESLGSFPVAFAGRVIVQNGSFLFRTRDVMFCGQRADLIDLIGFGRFYDGVRFGHRIAAEERWFSHPFLRVPIIREFFAIADPPGLRRALATARDASAGSVPLPQFVTDLLLTYQLILQTHFIQTDAGLAPPDIPASPDALLDRAVDRTLDVLRGPGWTQAPTAESVRSRAAALIEGAWRHGGLDARGIDELAAFQAALPDLSPVFVIPTVSPAAAGQTDDHAASLLAGIDEGPGETALRAPADWIERVVAGETLALERAAFQRAKDLWRGRGIAQDRQQAIAWLTMAAYNWEPRAQLLLGLARHRGIGAEPDRMEAMRHLVQATLALPRTRAAPRALLELLEAAPVGEYERANVVDPLAQSGNPHARYLVATLLEEGRILPMDKAAARQHFEWAAANGHRGAQQRLQPERPPTLLARVAGWLGSITRRGDR